MDGDEVYLLVNPAAGVGRAAKTSQRVVQALERAGASRVNELVAAGPSEVAGVVAKAIAEGCRRLVIGGGDGLVHLALPALAGTGTVCGIISVGTGNDFARALRLPTNIEDAARAALGDPGAVDLVAANPQPTPGSVRDALTDDSEQARATKLVATVATSGFSGRVNEVANRLRFPRGQLRYTVATLMTLPRLEPTAFTIDVDGVISEHAAALIAVANTQYFGGGMAICPDARPDDGLVHLAVIGDVSPFTLGRLLPTVFSGRHVEHPSVTIVAGAKVTVTSDQSFWADGEPLTRKPVVSFSVVPGTLLVAGSTTLAET